MFRVYHVWKQKTVQRKAFKHLFENSDFYTLYICVCVFLNFTWNDIEWILLACMKMEYPHWIVRLLGSAVRLRRPGYCPLRCTYPLLKTRISQVGLKKKLKIDFFVNWTLISACWVVGRLIRQWSYTSCSYWSTFFKMAFWLPNLHLLIFSFYRCVEPKIETTIEAPKRKLTTRPPLLATTSTTTTAAAAGSALLAPPENVNLVPCVQHHKCIGK